VVDPGAVALARICGQVSNRYLEHASEHDALLDERMVRNDSDRRA